MSMHLLHRYSIPKNKEYLGPSFYFFEQFLIQHIQFYPFQRHLIFCSNVPSAAK